MRALGRLTLWIARFRIEGAIPERAKLVVIVAPHTSNWDFVIGLAARYVVHVRIAWLGKHTLFVWPIGVLFRHWGGIPVDRRSSHDVVAQAVARFADREQLVLAIAPEGTRKAVSRWKTGFWHIAKGAGVPIVPVALDWGRRVVRIGDAVQPGESVDDDVEQLRRFFDGVRGAQR
jgi:1-acyl-sn-glycerol-3-phosphate acyltransferase